MHLSPGKSVSLMELPSSSSADQPPGSSLTRQPVPTGSSTPTRGKRAAKPQSTKSRKKRTKNTVLNSKQEAPKVLAVQDSTREGEVPVELEVGGNYFVKLKTAKTKPLYALEKLTDFVNDDYVKMQLYNMI